jgi:hypothetical protein
MKLDIYPYDTHTRVGYLIRVLISHTILTYKLGFAILWVILVFMLQRGNGFKYELKVQDTNANFGDGDRSRSSTY